MTRKPARPPTRPAVLIDRVVTRGGDAGETSLGDGSRVPKDAPRIEAMGAVDEANAAIGLLRLHAGALGDAVAATLARIQNDLFDLGAELCMPPPTPPEPPRRRLTATHLHMLDAAIAALNAGLPPLMSFVLPGGTPAAAQAHLARTIARRAERRVVRLAQQEPVNANLVRYLNRLSDYLFVVSRAADPAPDLWQPGGAAP